MAACCPRPERPYSPFRRIAKRLMSDLDALARLRSLILTDETLADRLAPIEQCDAFADATVDLAAAAGLTIDRAALLAVLRPDPLGLGRFDDGAPTMTVWPGRQWLPVAIVDAPGQLAVDWAHFGDITLTDPFFEDSLRRARRLPINTLVRVRTPLADMMGTSPSDTTGPDALIFHMSRCGSTLVSQMLAAIPGTVTVSEPPPLDSVVQLIHTHPQVPLEERVALLRGMAAALGRDRFGDRRRYVIKTDSWHSLALPLFRAAFPNTPWLFLFRNPIEVLASQARSRGWQTVPGMLPDQLFAIPDALGMPPGEYIARVLARVNQAAADHADIGGGLFVDYAELPEAFDRRILPHFAIEANPEARAAMRATTARNAKTPGMPFEPDSRRKREEAGTELRRVAAAHLDPLHARLSLLADRR